MTPLSSLIFDLWRAARAAPEPTLPLREAAAVLATRGYGLETVTAQPALINLAALALSGRERLVVHHLRPSVPRLVAATDLHALPDAPPPLLAGPWLVEVGRPERGERLWGDTWCLGGYLLDGVHYLIGLEGGGIHVVPWRPRWAGGELAEGVSTERSALIDEGLLTEHVTWGREAARFAVILSLLLEAAGAPLREREEDVPRPPRGTPRAAPQARPWTVRRVSLTPEEERDQAARPAGAGVGAAGAEGRVEATVRVRGYLKCQRHGPGNSLKRWIWVEGYAARRWVSPWSTTVVMGGGKPS